MFLERMEGNKGNLELGSHHQLGRFLFWLEKSDYL
jgi:hypothetical protein